VRGTPVTDAGVASLTLPDTRLGNLEELDVSWTGVTDEGIVSLAGPSSGVRRVVALQLAGLKVTDRALQAIASAANCASLERLQLANTGVTDDGMLAIAGSGSLIRDCSAIDLRGTKVTAVGVSALQAKWPRIRIDR
jgi:hypothetical protein